MTDTPRIEVPYRLEPFGGIGWSVRRFRSLADARAWALQHPAAWMPCWDRERAWGGQRLGATDSEVAS